MFWNKNKQIEKAQSSELSEALPDPCCVKCNRIIYNGDIFGLPSHDTHCYESNVQGWCLSCLVRDEERRKRQEELAASVAGGLQASVYRGSVNMNPAYIAQEAMKIAHEIMNVQDDPKYKGTK